MRITRNIPTLPALIAVAAFGVTACSDSPSPSAAVPRASDVPVEVNVSSAVASAGTRVAVAIKLDATAPATGGIQGALEFDAARLTYIGQSPVGDAITLVNARSASTGKLRFTSFNPMGISNRVALFVFESKGAGYAPSLKYVHQKAVASRGDMSVLNVVARAGGISDASLTVPADARAMTVGDWAARLLPAGGRNGAVSAAPGEYRTNLKYGDINYSTSVDLEDYLAIANAAVGNDQIISGTDGPTDVDLVIAGNVSPNNGGGACGTETDGSRVIDLSDYLAIANEAVGFNEDCVGDVIPGRGPLATTRQQINATSTPSLIVATGQTLTLTKDKVWEINGQLRVQDGGILDIQEGTRIEGLSSSTAPAIFVERGGRILAEGTQNEPIVMTCTAAVKTEGCWGGLFVSGKAPINLGDAALGLSPDGCAQRGGEGGAPLYGGCNPADNSGIIRYVRIEFAGFLLSTNNELNGLTLAGVGNGTQVDHVQVHAGQDDGIEFFGGTVSTKYLVLTGNDDDQFDISFGNAADHQFVIIQSDVGAANNDSKAIEADGNEPAPGTNATPRTSPRLWNFTIIGNLSAPTQAAAVQLRRGSGLRLYNSVVAGWPIGVDFDDALTCDAFGDGPVQIKHTTFVGVANLGNDDASDPLCAGATSTTEGEEQYVRGQTTNTETSAAITTIFKDAYNTQLPDFRMLFIGGQPALGNTLSPSTIPGSTAVATNYRGAVAPSDNGIIPWYAGWTRGFTTATTP